MTCHVVSTTSHPLYQFYWFDRERFCSVQGACEQQNGRKKWESPAGSSRENKVVRATSGCVVFCPQFENNLVEPGSGSGVATGSLISWKSVADGAGGACVTSSKPPVTPGSKVKTALGPAIRLIKIPKPRFLRESEAIGLMKWWLSSLVSPFQVRSKL